MMLIKINKVWTLVDFPKGRKVIDNKWILKIERKIDDTIEGIKHFWFLKRLYPWRKNRLQRDFLCCSIHFDSSSFSYYSMFRLRIIPNRCENHF